MGKSRRENNGSREVEHLKGEIRSLRKKLRQSEKHHRVIDEFDPNEETPEAVNVLDRDVSICPKCFAKNSITQIETPHKTYEVCKECDYRAALKGK